MSSSRVIVVLTDGEANLAHYMDLLRDQGYRVLATSRTYEAVLFVARNAVTCVLARASLLPEPAEDFLRQLRDFNPRPFIVVSGEEDGPIEGTSPLVDLFLTEPYRFASLMQAMEYGVERQDGPRRPSLSPEPLPEGDPPRLTSGPRRIVAATTRLLASARRLTELERDKEELLSTGLEMFLELVDAERGSILLCSKDQKHLELVRRAGFPADVEPFGRLALGQGYAGEVALTGRPLLVTNAPPREGYRTRSFLVVPLMDKKVVFGVVNLTERRGGEPFTNDDLELVSLLAHQFAVNLSNAEKWEELHKLAVVDPLTGLFNRRFFDRQISVELERARRYQRHVTLALLDIDNFKVINDLNGYITGDAVIKVVAEIIRRNFREVDVVTRWGGDEFAVLLPETHKPRSPASEDAVSHNYVERVRSALEDAEPEFRKQIPKLSGRITVSAGVATFPVDAQDRDQLFALANQALHRAKRSGQNRVCVAGEEPQDLAASD